MKLYLDMNDGYLHFKLNGDKQFNTIVSYMRMNYVPFDRKTKSYVVEPSLKALNVYDELKDYVNIEVSEDDLEMLKMCIYPPSNELKKIKYSIDSEIIKNHPPLKGKEGYEDFQREAMNKLVKTNRAILDISCRHGKTPITVMSMTSLFKKGVLDKALIVCRNEGVQNFASELCFFSDEYFNENNIRIVATSNRDIESYFKDDVKVIITNYITFRLSCLYYNENASAKSRKPIIDFSKWGKNRLIVLDECQSINTYSTIQSHLLHLHKDYFDYRWSLSGTLGYNFLHWYSLCKFMLPNRIPFTFSEWRNYVCDDNYGKQINVDRAKEFKEQILDKLLLTYHDCIIQTKNYENLIYCVMSEKMRNLYRTYCDKFINDIFSESNGEPKSNDVLNKFGVLSEMTSDPSLKDEFKNTDWKFSDNPKLEVLDSLVEKYCVDENRKIIIWSVHPQILNNLKKRYSKYKPCVIHGDSKTSVEKSERMNVLNEFKSDKDSKILLTNSVLSTSISIVECTRQIYYDLPLSSDTFNQSKERIRGAKQKEETQTDILLFDRSVDLYIWNEILQKKEKTRKAMLDKGVVDINDFKNLLNPKREYYIDGQSC